MRWRIKSPAPRLFIQPFIQAQIKENIKLRITGLCEGNSPVTGEFPAQMASNAENGSIWWRHHIITWPKTGSWILGNTLQWSLNQNTCTYFFLKIYLKINVLCRMVAILPSFNELITPSGSCRLQSEIVLCSRIPGRNIAVLSSLRPEQSGAISATFSDAFSWKKDLYFTNVCSALTTWQ